MQQIERLTYPYIIEIDGLSCEIDNQAILHDLSFKVPAGSFCCLLGKSGCGKTTLFRALAGLNEVQKGNITINGQKVVENGVSYVSSHQRKIGLVFQDYTLFPHLSIRDNLLFGAPKCSFIEQKHIVNKLLDLVDLQGFENRFPHELSGGQQQRIALGRTLAANPLLVLLDEPFSNLEQDQRWHLATQVKRILREQSVSALLVTHDQKEAFAFADYIGIIIDGKLVQWGKPEDIYYYPKDEKVAEFIGSGNWYDCQYCEHKHGEQVLITPFGTINLSDNPQMLSDKVKSMLQHTPTLQIFLRQENIYLPVDVSEYSEKVVDSNIKSSLNFPLIKEWQVIDKRFSGFLSYVDVQPILDENDSFSDYKDMSVTVFIRSNRTLIKGQKVQVELELSSLILRPKPL